MSLIKDMEHEIDFLTKSLGCKPVADIEAFSEDKLGYADLVEETNNDATKVVRITGVKNRGRMGTHGRSSVARTAACLSLSFSACAAVRGRMHLDAADAAPCLVCVVFRRCRLQGVCDGVCAQ